MTKHECQFNEVLIESSDEDDVLKAGMRVLIPCECGETPLDHLSMVEGYFDEAQAALQQVEPFRPLFHWAPTERRKQIIRYGLRPSMKATVSFIDGVWSAPYICLADTPSWAWGLSGQMSWTPVGQWDLWQTTLDLVRGCGKVTVLPSDDRPSGIYEVRVEGRIYKRHLWYVGSRLK